MEQFWAWDKVDFIDSSGYMLLVWDRCDYFEKEIWFELGNSMWRKHQITFQDHVKYIQDYIVKHFRFSIIQYAEKFLNMHDLGKYLSPPSTKGG